MLCHPLPVVSQSEHGNNLCRPFRGFVRVPFSFSGLCIALVVRVLAFASAENRKENREENRLQHGFPVTFEFCSQ